MSAGDEQELVDRLQRKIDMFVWAPSDMSHIDTKFVSHHMDTHSSAKLVAQRKQKVGEENGAIIDEEMEKLSNFRFITKTKYPTWMTNIVLVQKVNNK